MFSTGVPSSEERRRKIVKLYREEGLSVRDLATRFGVSYWTIRNELMADAKAHGEKETAWRNGAAKQ